MFASQEYVNEQPKAEFMPPELLRDKVRQIKSSHFTLGYSEPDTKK